MPKLANSAWSTAEYLWYPLMAIASTPFMLKGLGSEKYGLWMMFTATVVFGTVLNIGTGVSVIKQISTVLGQSRPELIEKILQGSLAVALVGGGCLALLITSIFLFVGDSVFAKMGDARSVHLTGYFAALLAWIEQIDNVFASALKGAERFSLAARVEMAAKIGQVLVSVATVMVGGGLLELYINYGLVTLLRLFIKGLITKNNLKISNISPDFSEGIKTIELSKWGWLQGLGGMTFGLADRFIIGSILGATSLAHYSIAMQLAAPIHSVTSAALSIVFPMVSRRQSNDSKLSLNKLSVYILIANVVICSITAGFILIFGNTILSFWLGIGYPQEIEGVLRYLTFAFWILALNITPYNILLGLGKMKSTSVIVIASGAVGLLPIYFGCLWYGLIGATVGKIIFALLALTLFYPLSRELFKSAKLQ